jgi:tellurite resistance protein
MVSRVLDTAFLRRLRDQLLERGAPSLVPKPRVPLEDLPSLPAASLDRVAPHAELLFLMLSVDGKADRRELATIRGAVRTLADGLLRGGTADDLVDRFRAQLDAEGLARRLEAVTAKLAADREDAELAALLAAAVALADEQVDTRERALFDEIIEGLGIGKRRLDEILGRW